MPTDFSICAERAFAHAADLADHFDAEVHVLHVVVRQRENACSVQGLIPVSEGEVAEQLHLLSGYTHKEGRSTEGMKIVQTSVQHGSASVAIMDYADQHAIDLIVMGTHGRKGFDRWVARSVAEDIIRLGACPVLTIQEGEHPFRGGLIQRILVPVDFSEYSRATLKYANALARAYGSRVDVLHVIEEAAIPSTYGVEPGALSDEKLYERTWDALLRFVQRHGCGIDAHLSVTVGHPGPGIIEFARTHKADLIVISTHGRTGLARLFMGSVAEKIVRTAPCPVLTIKGYTDMLFPDEEEVLRLEYA